jgi:PTH1 family peptidyl-tRNA hydrolase
MLVVGLGNPGAEYYNTRHNIGFKAVDIISDRLNLSWKESSKFRADIASGSFQGAKIIIAKPNTYMNLSGESISLIKNYYNVKIDDIVVFHDELDIPLGTMKYKIGGGSAGHNGIKSLDQHITPQYHRIRIGIGRPERGDVSNFVLSNFSESEKEIIIKLLDHIKDNSSELIEKKFNSIVSLK